MNVLIVCAAGMSSSALKEQMIREIRKQNLDIKVGACGSSQVYIYAKRSDLVLIAPQISYMKEDIINQSSKECLIIPEDAYGKSDGSALVDMTLHPEKYKERADGREKIRKVAAKMSSNIYVLSIMDGFRMIMPVSMIGSVFSLLVSFPVSALNTVITDSILGEFFELGYQMTLGLISIYLSFSIAMCFAKRSRIRKEGLVLATVIDFMALCGVSNKGWLNLEFFDGNGMLTAILCSILTYKIYAYADHFMDHSRKTLISNNIIESLYSLIPVSLCMIMTLIFSGIFYMKFHMYFTQWSNLVLSEKIGELAGNNMFTMLFLSSVAVILWFTGIHGGKIVGTVRTPLFKPLSLANLNAWKNGLQLPYVCIEQSSYIYIFGGVGSTLCLAFLMAFFSKSNKLKQLGKIAFPMGIFFINEPLIFGLPYVFNLSLLFPFLFVPFASGVMTIALTSVGILPRCIGIDMPWTTPPVMSGLIQGGWKLALWQVVLLILQMVMWYPFFKKMDEKAVAFENRYHHEVNNLK